MKRKNEGHRQKIQHQKMNNNKLKLNFELNAFIANNIMEMKISD